MGKCILAQPDWVMVDPSIVTVAFSGGSWLPALPASNLLSPWFANLARSTNLQWSSTQVWTDLGTQRGVQVAALPRHNLSTGAQVRLRGCLSKDVSTVVCDTGWQDVYPTIYPADSLFWGSGSFWDGKMAPEDVALFPMPWSYVWDAPQVARWWLLEISDTNNPDGYVDLARLLLAPGWQPSFNMGYGASLAIEDPSVATQSMGGAVFFDQRTKKRVVRFGLNYLPQDEALAQANDMAQRLGTSGQLFFVWDPDTPEHAHRRNFLARMRTLSPLEAAVHARLGATYELEEVTA